MYYGILRCRIEGMKLLTAGRLRRRAVNSNPLIAEEWRRQKGEGDMALVHDVQAGLLTSPIGDAPVEHLRFVRALSTAPMSLAANHLELASKGGGKPYISHARAGHSQRARHSTPSIEPDRQAGRSNYSCSSLLCSSPLLHLECSRGRGELYKRSDHPD